METQNFNSLQILTKQQLDSATANGQLTAGALYATTDERASINDNILVNGDFSYSVYGDWAEASATQAVPFSACWRLLPGGGEVATDEEGLWVYNSSTSPLRFGSVVVVKSSLYGQKISLSVMYNQQLYSVTTNSFDSTLQLVVGDSDSADGLTITVSETIDTIANVSTISTVVLAGQLQPTATTEGYISYIKLERGDVTSNSYSSKGLEILRCNEYVYKLPKYTVLPLAVVGSSQQMMVSIPLPVPMVEYPTVSGTLCTTSTVGEEVTLSLSIVTEADSGYLDERTDGQITYWVSGASFTALSAASVYVDDSQSGLVLSCEQTPTYSDS